MTILGLCPQTASSINPSSLCIIASTKRERGIERMAKQLSAQRTMLSEIRFLSGETSSQDALTIVMLSLDSCCRRNKGGGLSRFPHSCDRVLISTTGERKASIALSSDANHCGHFPGPGMSTMVLFENDRSWQTECRQSSWIGAVRH